MNHRTLNAVVGLACCLAAPALAGPRESATFTAAPSNGVLGSPLNTVRTQPFAGGYPLGRITYTGTLVSQHPLTWSSDCRILVTAPGGATATIRPVQSGSTFSTVNYSGSLFMPSVGNPAGVWTFRFYESLDDGGNLVDALNTVTITLTDDPPAAPAATDLGVLGPAGVDVPPFIIPARQVAWFAFEAPNAADALAGTFLDLNTVTTDPGSPDSRLALFDEAGSLIALDDDSGPGLAGQLTFGAGGGAPLLDGQPRDGRNGPLPAGRYYLAVGPETLAAGAGFWNASSTTTGDTAFGLLLATNLCRTDFNGDGFLDFFDYDDFVNCFETGACPPGKTADFNGDDFVDFFDYDDFVAAFESGC